MGIVSHPKSVMNKLKTKEDVENLIEELGYEDVLIFSNPSYASAFLGISEDNRAIYDFDLMVEFLMEEEGWSNVEAIEFIEYNCIRTLPYYEKSPIIMYRLVE